jgi:hypothetical protein
MKGNMVGWIVRLVVRALLWVFLDGGWSGWRDGYSVMKGCVPSGWAFMQLCGCLRVGFHWDVVK